MNISDISCFEHAFDKSRYEREIKRIYGSVAAEVIALQDKMGWYDIDRVKVYREKWDEVCNILSDCPSSKEMLSLCKAVGLDYNDFLNLYGKEKIDDALLYAKDLKDRYSVLWVWFDLFSNM